jgi:flagellar basal-body rod protein FlgB
MMMMMVDYINSITNDVLAKAMDGHFARQKSIASNIANAETPGYRHRDVDFQSALKEQLNAVRNGGKGKVPGSEAPIPSNLSAILEASSGNTRYSSAITSSPIEVKVDENFRYRNDGNGVDLEAEMVALAKNASKFKSLTKLQAKTNNLLRNVLNNTQG